jgi:hypothetical protein
MLAAIRRAIAAKQKLAAAAECLVGITFDQN